MMTSPFSRSRIVVRHFGHCIRSLQSMTEAFDTAVDDYCWPVRDDAQTIRTGPGLSVGSPNKPLRTIHLTTSMTGTIENANARVSNQSFVEKLNVPNAGWRNGTYTIAIRITNSQTTAMFSQRSANGRRTTDSRSERQLYALK